MVFFRMTQSSFMPIKSSIKFLDCFNNILQIINSQVIKYRRVDEQLLSEAIPRGTIQACVSLKTELL